VPKRFLAQALGLDREPVKRALMQMVEDPRVLGAELADPVEAQRRDVDAAVAVLCRRFRCGRSAPHRAGALTWGSVFREDWRIRASGAWACRQVVSAVGSARPGLAM
jgi:hypothetical protein